MIPFPHELCFFSLSHAVLSAFGPLDRASFHRGSLHCFPFFFFIYPTKTRIKRLWRESNPQDFKLHPTPTVRLDIKLTPRVCPFSAPSSHHTFDASYDRGSTFPLKCFLNDGDPQPKIVGMPILFREMALLYTWAVGFSIEMQSVFWVESVFGGGKELLR